MHRGLRNASLRVPVRPGERAHAARNEPLTLTVGTAVPEIGRNGRHLLKAPRMSQGASSCWWCGLPRVPPPGCAGQLVRVIQSNPVKRARVCGQPLLMSLTQPGGCLPITLANPKPVPKFVEVPNRVLKGCTICLRAGRNRSARAKRFLLIRAFFYRSALAIYIVRASAPLAARSTICSSLQHPPRQHQPKLNSAMRAMRRSMRSAACSSTSSQLAPLKKLESFCWLLLRCGSGCGLRAEKGARGSPPGGRGASIILGGGDPRRPEIYFKSIRVLGPKMVFRSAPAQTN
jgi:hypothetical protein